MLVRSRHPMFTSLESMLKRADDASSGAAWSAQSAGIPQPEPATDPVGGEQAPIYQALALSDEMREAIFPTTPRMVSVLFRVAAPKT